jgi:hypothetical protein
MGAGAAAAVGPALKRELVADGATFTVVGDDTDLRFAVTATAAWGWEEGALDVDVPLEEVEQLAGLFSGRTGSATLAAWPGLRFRVVK